METEHDRLTRLYAELGDEHLQDLADQPEDLTDEARLALNTEMRKRGLSPEPQRDLEPGAESIGERESGFNAGIPGIFPSGAATMEQALEQGGTERAGWVSLISFYDGLELTKACENLEDSDVDFAIQEVLGDALSGGGTRYELWIKPSDQDLAQRVLREKLGLFPLAEFDPLDPLNPLDETEESDKTDAVSSADPSAESAGMMTIGNFETSAEASEVTRLLLDAGITSRTEAPARDEVAGDGESWWQVEVHSADHERALQVVTDGLGLTAQN